MLILKENQRERVERSLSGQIGAAKVQQPLGSVGRSSLKWSSICVAEV